MLTTPTEMATIWKPPRTRTQIRVRDPARGEPRTQWLLRVFHRVLVEVDGPDAGAPPPPAGGHRRHAAWRSVGGEEGGVERGERRGGRGGHGCGCGCACACAAVAATSWFWVPSRSGRRTSRAEAGGRRGPRQFCTACFWLFQWLWMTIDEGGGARVLWWATWPHGECATREWGPAPRRRRRRVVSDQESGRRTGGRGRRRVRRPQVRAPSPCARPAASANSRTGQRAEAAVITGSVYLGGERDTRALRTSRAVTE
jgi:hypothetical protein